MKMLRETFLRSFASSALALMCLASTAKAAISVGPAGSGTLTLDSPPAASEWATAVLPGGGTTYQSVTALDGGVAGLDAANITTTLPTSGTVPPSTSSLGYRYNTSQNYIQSRPTTSGTNAANVLKATLQNDTGDTAFALTISYDFNITSPQAAGTDELPGWYAYYSVSGSPNTWVPIPTLSAVDTAGFLTASVDLSATPWAAGTPMYVLWVDDNDDGQTDTGYNMDNVVFTASSEPPELDITLISPTNGESFVEGQIIPARAIGSGPITNVTFFLDGAFLAAFPSPPYSWDFTTAAGNHTIYAEAQDDTGARVYSETNTIQVVPNQPPTIVITNAVDRSTPPISGDTFPVGASILFQADVQDDVGVISVDWYLDGNLFLTGNETDMTYNDALAGTHTVTAVATDGSGLQAVSPDYTITVTNPPSNFVRFIENGEEWRYYATNLTGIDPNTLLPPADGDDNMWYQPGYDDFSWATGIGELGNGDTGGGYPERTMIDIGPTGARYPTIYFRKTFEINEVPSTYGAFVLNILQDDGAVVWVNGMAVWTNAFLDVIDPVMGIVYTNLTSDDSPHDGRDYQTVLLDPSLFMFGLNTIAVEMHQVNATSSDLSFDLMLWGELPTLPVITILNPTNNAVVPGGCAGATVTIDVQASTFVTNLTVFLDNVEVGAAGDVNGFNNQPVAIDVMGIVPGQHMLYVQGDDSYGVTGYSGTNTITALPNQPPSVAITNLLNGTNFLVGSVVTAQLEITDDGTVTNFQFLVNGVVDFESTTAEGEVRMSDMLVGTHVLRAVAWDDCGVASTSAPVSITVTNPVQAVILANGEVWNYYFNSNEPPADLLGNLWYQPAYDDSSWSSGQAELGYGDTAQNDPERTNLDPFGTNLFYAAYFRHTFNAMNAAQFTNLIVNLLADDGGIVYLNGTEIWRYRMPEGPVGYGTFAAGGAVPGDGTIYASTNINPTGLLLPGLNVVAVEVHQDNDTSSDISFDLMIWGEGAVGPTPPEIDVVNNGDGTMTLSWPVGAFVPYSTTDISVPRANWQPYTDQTPVVNNGRMELTVPTTGPQRFFGVRMP